MSNNEEINLLEIKSFEELFNLLKKGEYTTKKLEKDIQNFCLESEKNNYKSEKIKEYNNIIKEETLFDKFKLNKNRFDFKLSISALIIRYYNFVKKIKPENKEEYYILKKIYEIFYEIKKNDLIMEDIQCLLKNGILFDYDNNFFTFLFDTGDKYTKQILSLFDLKSYFLTDTNNIKIFISYLNELINSYSEKSKQFLFIRKIITLLNEVLILLENNDNINNINNEQLYIIKTYKEKIMNSINKNKIFEIFFTDEEFLSHLDILLSAFKTFPKEIDNQINILINKKDKQITKALMKFVLKSAMVLKNFISEKTLNLLNDISIENSFKFHLKQYINGKDRIINIYNRFKNNENIIKLLIEYLLENNKKEQAKLIQENKYNEEDEYQLEEKIFLEKNKNNNYLKLPEDYKIYYISAEDNDNITKSKKILNEIIKKEINKDRYMGIDTEWKSSNNFYDQYQENINININNNSNLGDIIQIAGMYHGFIFDIKSIEKNQELKEKIKKIFLNTKFIGFDFRNDIIRLGKFFKEIIYKNEFIDLIEVYKQRMNKKTPELKIITLDFFGKELDKRDQTSDWSKRPLLKNQIIYGILDAYVLIFIYQKLNEK